MMTYDSYTLTNMSSQRICRIDIIVWNVIAYYSVQYSGSESGYGIEQGIV